MTYIEANFPHAPFMIFENWTPFCRGIVFHMDALKQVKGGKAE